MEYYLEEGPLYMMDFTHHGLNFDEFARMFPDKYFGLEKLVKYYDEFNAIDIIYHKEGGIKMGVSLYGNYGTLFWREEWNTHTQILFNYVRFIMSMKAIRNYLWNALRSVQLGSL